MTKLPGSNFGSGAGRRAYILEPFLAHDAVAGQRVMSTTLEDIGHQEIKKGYHGGTFGEREVLARQWKHHNHVQLHMSICCLSYYTSAGIMRP